MLQDMLRSGVLAVALFSLFTGMSFAVVDDDDEIAQNIALEFARAESLALKGETEQAISAYNALIRLKPQLPEAYNNLAALYLKQKKSKQAKAILEQGIYAHKGYGALYESLTSINVAMAREAYSKALQIDLSPANIEIASLSLNDATPTRKKSTIVISKAVIPDEVKNVVEVKAAIANQPAKEIKAIVAAKASGEIKRVSNVVSRKQTPDKQIINTDALETVVQAWSAAWSAQAIEIYLSFYHRHYKPSDGLSRNGWEQSRRLKLKKPNWIKVAISDFNIEKNDGRQAIVRFKQAYQSNTYSDITSKRMVLLYTENGWRIFQEKSI